MSGLSTPIGLGEVGRDLDVLGQQAEREAGGELARDEMLLGHHLGVEALAGRDIHDVDHGGRVEPELLADQHRLGRPR